MGLHHVDIISTRIVRGSDYSPTSELFARVRKTMTGNNPKLDLRLVRFCQFVLKVLSVNEFLTSFKGQDCQNFAKKDRQQSQAESCQY